MKSILAGVAAAALGLTAAHAAPLEAYGKLPNIEPSQFALSPLGDKIAFVGAGATGRQLVVRSLAGETLMQFAISKNKVRYLRWAGDDHVLLGTSSTLNNMDSSGSAVEEASQVIVLTPSTHNAFAVFQGQKSIWPQVVGDYGAFQIDGKWYAFFGGVTMLGTGNSRLDVTQGTTQGAYTLDHSFPDLYRVDLDTGVHLKTATGTPFLSEMAIGAGGKVVAHADFDTRSGAWSLYAGGEEKHRVLSKTSSLAQIGLEGIGPTPQSVIVIDTSTEDNGAYAYDLAHGDARTELAKDAGWIRGIRDINNVVVGAELERDRPETEFFVPAIEQAFERARKPFGKLHTQAVSADASWKKWIILTDGEGDSGSYYLVDLDAAKAEMIATMYPDIDTPDVGAIRVIDYKAADGLQLSAILTLPPGKADAKNLPVVILPHGGPEAHDSPVFDWLAQGIASQGYAVFQPNFRGSGGLSTSLRDAGYGEWGRKMQTDISDGLAELAKQGIVDPKRACIVGASYGGYAALAGVTVQHGIYRCAVSYAGPADLNNMLRWETDRGGQQTASFRYWKKYMGAKSEGDGSLREISPIAFAKRADAPILLIHGKNDSVVPIDQSRTMAAALHGAGKPVEMVELDDEDHWLSTESSRVAMLKAAVDFLKKNNPPG